MRTINAYLPLFAGFYESSLENSDTEYYAIHNEMDWIEEDTGEETEYDDFTFDYESRHQDIIEAFVECYNNLAPDFVQGIKFKELVSPRYYNFSTDKIWAEITFEEGWREELINFLKTDPKIKDLIYENHTSYDGFLSFMDNDVNKWIEWLEKDDDDDSDIYVMYTLVYYMGAKNGGLERLKDELTYGALEDIYDESYVSRIEKAE